LELGVPFSDPIADGPVIQAADGRALRQGFDIPTLFRFIRAVRSFSDIPIGLLLYYNLVLQRGKERFYREARQAGVNSILIADLPLEEADAVLSVGRKFQVETVFLVTELTTEARLKKILRDCRGFVYVVARLGVTGVRQEVQALTLKTLKRMRPLSTLPLCVGFGVSQPEHVRKIAAAGADGIIVGSALVKIIEKTRTTSLLFKRIEKFVRSMKKPLVRQVPHGNS